jgi:DNA polymerase III subunit gamma/tau
MTDVQPERSGFSLAAWYRPKRFVEVVGQRHVTAVLQRSVAHDRLPAQLLFSGGSGLGKTTLARVTAAALLCETPMDERRGDACGVCASCLDITTPGRIHPDVIEFDAASNGGKDEIRAIAERARLVPLRGAKKVYIIDEAHGLSGPGGQAFLKLLEEPPPHVVFMLATTDPDKMLATNRGRCTEYELSGPTPDEMATNLLRVALAEGWSLSLDAALAIVAASDGALGVRATLMSLEKLSSLLDDGDLLTPDDVALQLQSASRPLLDSLIEAIIARDSSAAFIALGRLRDQATDATLFDALIEWARGELLASTPTSFERARYRLAQLVGRPRTPGYLEIALANLVRPQDADALAALIEEAREIVRQVPSTLHETDSSTKLPESIPDPDAFLALVSKNLPRAAAILNTCALVPGPGTLRIVAPDEVKAPLRALAEELRPLAEQMGIRLSLASPGRP